MQKLLKNSAVAGFLLLALSAFGQAVSQPVEFGRILLRVNDINLTVEYAETFDQRARGLMNRTELCQDCGMLFHYSSPRIASMWMKNTLIPLDIAFITSDGRIANIRSMQPQDLTSIKSTEAVLYALEMNKGWFEANKIQVGDILSIGPEL